MAEKKDIYYHGKIYVGVTPARFGRADHWNTESEAEDQESYEAYINHITSFTSYPVSGTHNFTDGQDVTGLYFKSYKLNGNVRKTVAIPIPAPVPPVKDVKASQDKEDMEAEARSQIQPIPLPVSFLDWVSDEKYMRLSKSVGGKWFKVGESERYTSIELFNIFEKEIKQ